MPSKFPALRTTQENPDIYKKRVLNFPTRGVIAQYPLQIFSCDLYDLSTKPDGENRYIFNAIDVYSRKYFFSVMQGKAIEDIKKAFSDIMHQAGKPEKVWFDREPAVVSYEMLERLKAYGVTLYHTHGKSVFVESFHRTLGGLLVKNLGQELTGWASILPEIAKVYNNTTHSATNTTPNQAFHKKDKGTTTFHNMLNFYSKREEGKLFKIGDQVRIAVKRKTFDKKSRSPNWSNEIYTVQEVRETNPRTYKVSGIDKYFYTQELMKA